MMRRSSLAFASALTCALPVSVARSEPLAPSEPAASAPAAAAAPPETSSAEVARCVAEHENARLQRVREQWLLARGAMTRCSDESCPLSIRTDCRAWLEELARLLPTVLIVVERDDERGEPVQLELDGEPLKLPEPLGPIELLPGRHRLRAELGGYAPLEREIVLDVGVKNQVVRLRFSTVKAPSQVAELPARHLLPSPPSSSRPTPVLSYWFAGGALVAFATSGALLGSALASLDSARETCAPGCSSRVRDSIDRRLLAADVSAGVGALLAGLSLYSYLARPAVLAPRSELAPRLSWTGKGAELALSGWF